MESKEKYTLTMDASALKMFQTCELMWAYAYREHIKLSSTQVATKASALDKGTLVHLVLEAFYKAKLKYPAEDGYQHGQRALDAFFKHKLVTETYFTNEEIQFIKNRFVNYVAFWRDRDLVPVKKGDAVGVELGFSKVLYEDDNVLFVTEGKIDIINSLGHDVIGFCDHKSQERVNHLYYFRPQMLTYAWATGLNHAMINYFGLQKDFKDHTFRRESFEIPNWMIKRWEQKMLRIYWYIYSRDMSLFKLKDPSMETIEYIPEANEIKFNRNESSCSGAFDSSPCQYRYLCETGSDEMRNNIKQFKYEKVEVWQPWHIHYKEDSGIEV